MTSERNLGVTEARIGLSLLTCLLIALGYVVVQRLGDTGLAPPAEIRPDPAAASFRNSPASPMATGGRAQVSPAQRTESIPAPYPHVSRRPLWLAPQPASEITAPNSFDAAAPAAANSGEPGPFDPPPLPGGPIPGAVPKQ